MYFLEIDGSLNRLHVTFMRIFDEAQAKAFLRELERRLGELQEGFHLMTDLTNLEALEPSSTPHIKKAMDLCNEHGVGKVIRIIPDPIKNFGFTVMSHFHYDGSVPVVTCSNLEEAIKHLSQE